MNCAEFEQICGEFADGMTDEASKVPAEVHLLSCSACRLRLAEVSRLRLLLRSSLPAVAPPTIDAPIMAAFAAKHRREERFAGGFFAFFRLRHAFAAVAVALSAVGAFWLGRATAPEIVARPATVEKAVSTPVETIRYVEIPTVKYIEVPSGRRDGIEPILIRDTPVRRRSKVRETPRQVLAARPGLNPVKVDLSDFEPLDEVSPRVVRKGETYDK